MARRWRTIHVRDNGLGLVPRKRLAAKRYAAGEVRCVLTLRLPLDGPGGRDPRHPAPTCRRPAGAIGCRGEPYDDAKMEVFMKTLKAEIVHTRRQPRLLARRLHAGLHDLAVWRW